MNMKTELKAFLERRRRELAHEMRREYSLPSIRELASMADNMSPGTLERAFKGLSVPDYNNALKMASLFGDEILRILEYPEPVPNDWRIRLINKLYDKGMLTDEDVNVLSDTAKELAKKHGNDGKLERLETSVT